MHKKEKNNKKGKSPVKALINKIKLKIKKSIYLELTIGVLAALIVSVFVFRISYNIFRHQGAFRQVHVNYENSKYDMVDRFENIIYRCRKDYTGEEILKNIADTLYDDVFVTDNAGNVLYTGRGNSSSTLVTSKFNIDALVKSNCKTNVDNEGKFTYYDTLVIGDKVYYVIQSTTLSPEYMYGTLGLYLISGIIAVIFFFVLIFLMVKSKIQYIKYLSASVKEISKGNLNCKVEVKGLDELAVVANNINDMEENLNNKIENENKQNDVYRDLVTNISHDLKTPITIILGYIDIIRTHKYKDEAQKDEYLNITYDRTVSLQKMILKLFDLVKSEKTEQKLELRPVNVCRLLKQYMVEYEFSAKEKDISISNNINMEEMVVSIDLEKFNRIFNNIFDNAVKYCTEGGTIGVTVEDENSTALIDIYNTSNPVSSDDLEKIFNKLYRCDKARNSSIEGNGIGLSTVKELVEAHDGKVFAEYMEGVFHLKIRIRKIM